MIPFAQKVPGMCAGTVAIVELPGKGLLLCELSGTSNEKKTWLFAV